MNCHIRPIALSLLLIAAFAGSVFAQKKTAEKTAEKAQGTRLTPPPLSPVMPFTTPEVALAKTDETGKMLRMIVPRLKVVPLTQTYSVTRERTELRTRIVTKDGQKVEEQYPVSVPYTEQQTRSISALDATSKDRLKMPIEHVMAWALDGTRIDADELRKRAAKPMRFLVARKGFFPGLPAYFREAFNPNMVVIFVGKDFTKVYADGETPPKPSPTK